jgi:uncharacterized protein with GYD domain
MMTVKYSPDAVRALIAHPSDRRKVASEIIDKAGGKLHGFYLTFGPIDVVVILEAPSATAAAALSMMLGASGSFAQVATTPLLTMEEAMAAMKEAAPLQAAYKPITK